MTKSISLELKEMNISLLLPTQEGKLRLHRAVQGGCAIGAGVFFKNMSELNTSEM